MSMSIITLIIMGGLGALVSIASGYLWYLKTQPKKIIWAAEVYTISDSSKFIKDKDGKDAIELKDLKPYAKDVLQKIVHEHREIFTLQKLEKSTPAVENDNIENWGDQKRVMVLLHNEQCTLLKKGYDHTTGKIIFKPIPYDTQNLIKNEMMIRKARIQREKGLLEAILPYITIMFSFIFVFGMGYLVVSGYQDIAAGHNTAMIERDRITQNTTQMMRDGLIQINNKQAESAESYRISMESLNQQMARLEAILAKELNSSNP